MDHQNDPFAVFEAREDPEVHNLGKPEKKVRLDIQSSIVSNLLGDQNKLNLNDDGDASDNEAKKDMLDNIQIQVERSDQGCIHQIFYPKGYRRTQFQGPCNAKKYEFKLDPFQQKAVRAIQSNENVLVCAHTSAGKTAIAEYAISICMRDKSRVIYTSPIKALSNQKYRALLKQFSDVGLITGDVTINQTASCLVMTTQILRNMIYRGNEITREVKWVIFDEVHYMRDRERGVVWQQTIIMLPKQVKYVFLSATIGNPEQFATWITKLRKQPCNVVYTDYRPVPLQHYLCPAGGDGLYMVVDENGKFHQNHFNKAIQMLGETVNVIGMDQKKKKNLNQGSDLSKIIKVLMERNMDPAIIFSFSKKDVEAYARSIVTKYDLTTKQQKQAINRIFEDAIDVLDEVDRQLAPISSMRSIITKGIGIHHGGLLPLLKQTVQLLFQAGLIKILFSTETFSMGVNMPAKTVVFTSARKFDGETFRWIGGGQYIQMSGRAGRRGLDRKGITILMIDEKIEEENAKNMLKGNSDDLLSSFYINYNMLLNSQRLEDINPDYILARSLLQFQHEAKLPKLIEQHRQKVQIYKSGHFENQQDLETLYLLSQKKDDAKQKLRQLTYTPANITKYLNIGRIVRIKDGLVDWGYGYLVNFHKKQKNTKKKSEQEQSLYFVADIMVYAKKDAKNDKFQPQKLSQSGQMIVLTFTFACIYEITAIKITSMPMDLNSQTSKEMLKETLLQLTKKALQIITIPCSKPEGVQYKRIITETQKQIAQYKGVANELEAYKTRRKIYEQIRESSKNIKELSGIVLRKQKKSLMRVMKRVALVEKGVVTRKGNVTCEVSANHEILLTQLLFSGFFNDMNAIEIASILTSLVHQEKSQSDKKFTKNPKLKAKLQEMMNQAKQMYKVLHDCKVKIEQDDYLGSIKEQLIEVTYEWCCGATFAQICKMTQSYQGSIIRTMRRLNQLLKQMATAAKSIGNQELSELFDEASTKVFRGIVQAASLYTL